MRDVYVFRSPGANFTRAKPHETGQLNAELIVRGFGKREKLEHLLPIENETLGRMNCFKIDNFWTSFWI